MYNTFFRFFGLRENPFNVNPDPGYLYLNERTRGVLEEMAGAIQARKGLVVLTGEAGTGKTTLINRLKEWLQKQHTPIAFIFNPHLEVDELFDLMLAEYGIADDPHLKGSSLARLNQWLIERHAAGHNAVLILDEAQGLPAPVLEQVRMLLNHEMADGKLLQVVLSGQPELEEKLKRPEMRQIRQRISLRCYTAPITHEEARVYIRRRLQIAGGNDTEVFAPEAIEVIHLYARGIPRVMNLLSEHAMIRAFVNQIQPVSAASVQAVAKALQFDDVKPLGMQPLAEIMLSAPADFHASFPGEHTVVPLHPVVTPECELPEPPAIPAPPVAENPSLTWFGATLEPEPESPSETLFAEDVISESEERPKPVLVSELKNSRAASMNDASGLLVTPEPAISEAADEPVAPPKPAKKPIAIISIARKASSREAFTKGQDYLVILFSRASDFTLEVWDRIVALAKSQDWERNFNSLLRWLQQPIPTVKVHRRAGD